MNEIKKVTIAGSGVLGYQIAFQTAYHGFEVTIYDINDEVLNNAKEKFNSLAENYKKDLNASKDQISKVEKNLHYTSDLKEAIKNADLLIEAIPEDIKIKTEFYKKISKLAAEKTIFVSNSSTLLPSQFALSTGRPEKFLNLHFGNQIWLRNTAEIMSHPGTDALVKEKIIDFAKHIGMVPIVLKKEIPGYVLNSLLNPFLNAAMQLWIGDYASPNTIDKTWMLGTGSPYGPMALYDIVGLTTPYNIYKIQVENGKKEDKPILDRLKKEFIDQNKLGVSTGEGFYHYPNPAWQQKNFLSVPKADPSKRKIKNVVVAGSGVLGYQIAVQAAYSGYKTTVYDVSEESLDKAKSRFNTLAEEYKTNLKASEEQVKNTRNKLSYTTDLKNAIANTDLIIEAVPESLEIKKDFWQKASEYAPDHTIFASNSSTFLPSQLNKFVADPTRFINFHFANHIMIRNTVEIMASNKTNPLIYAEIVEFAKTINMLPIELKKEKSGYVLDSLLIPLLIAGLALWANDVADPETIDKTWMIATGASFGPMAILDLNGMNTNYNVVQNIPGDLTTFIAKKMKSDLINKGKLGQQSGEGFYKYPNPSWQEKDFLK
ncbi:3-hydroxyacyl-CoA dehydrogenase [Sphingobacterium lactis]|uniref:3-hydroxyacyl-CoA dehydrogenase n=1 Tax=Sphingobacterium lactis TaxID=797291 RepID=UPI003F7EE9FF